MDYIEFPTPRLRQLAEQLVGRLWETGQRNTTVGAPGATIDEILFDLPETERQQLYRVRMPGEDGLTVMAKLARDGVIQEATGPVGAAHPDDPTVRWVATNRHQTATTVKRRQTPQRLGRLARIRYATAPARQHDTETIVMELYSLGIYDNNWMSLQTAATHMQTLGVNLDAYTNAWTGDVFGLVRVRVPNPAAPNIKEIQLTKYGLQLVERIERHAQQNLLPRPNAHTRICVG